MRRTIASWRSSTWRTSRRPTHQPPAARQLGVEQARNIMNTARQDHRAYPIALPTLSDEAVVDIRNFIAHSRWQAGARADSVRPVGVDIRSGTAKWIVTDESRDWLIGELADEALKLVKVNERLQKFYLAAGLREIIDAKDAERSAAIDARDGRATKS